MSARVLHKLELLLTCNECANAEVRWLCVQAAIPALTATHASKLSGLWTCVTARELVMHLSHVLIAQHELLAGRRV